ncbi:EntF family bacteriocin induction factor [Enterococcus faecium]|nr:EntF family bacteriocin induction factor [Enterococcus faecium]
MVCRGNRNGRKNRLNAKQCSDQELKKIKGGAGTKPQGKPASNLVECVFSLYYLSN